MAMIRQGGGEAVTVTGDVGQAAESWDRSEAAYTVLFLMIHESSYMNGHVIVMDGRRMTIRNT